MPITYSQTYAYEDANIHSHIRLATYIDIYRHTQVDLLSRTDTHTNFHLPWVTHVVPWLVNLIRNSLLMS